jgi:CrcB protein
MNQIVAIAAGGSLGALARFWIANGIYGWLGRDFPHGTLFVNVSGSFFMGLLTELMLQRFALSVEYRAALLIGFLGAYTTFSTFAIETLYLFEEGSVLKAFLNIFLSVTLCLAFVWTGLILGRRLFVADGYPWLPEGFPYGMLAGSTAAAFAVGLATEALFQRADWSMQSRAVALIIVLGLSSTLSTLSLSLHLADKNGLLGSLGLFAMNALGVVGAVWAGILMGRQL